MHRLPAQKNVTPYNLFDAARFLQMALQSLHDELRQAGRTARAEKTLILKAF
jgi:hypothetical protein